ncbi:MAG: manganese catalase family protein [Merdibacter sp.]|nr:manganese catalase family protein [Merdibacter sp.]
MWIYEKKLQFPVNITCPDAKAAAVIISQLGGPDGEMAAALRYLSQRYTMPDARLQALLSDIGTEELAHVEIISAILYQLCDGLSVQQIKDAGLDAYFVDHTLGIYPQSAAGVPFTASYFQSKGDPITDLTEDMAAEQKARTTYDNILRLVDNEEVKKVIRFLRAREIVHYQRFAEGLEYLKTKLDPDNVYICNPSFDAH